MCIFEKNIMKSISLFFLIFLFQNFNSQGLIINWQKSFGGNGAEYGQSISKTSDGGYILAGSSNSTNIPSVTTHGGRDYFLVKINSIGVIVWQKFYGGSNDEFLYDVKETPDGGYILAGYTNSNNGEVTGSHGSADYWIVKTNENGDIVWQKTFGGSSIDVANSITLTNDGGYIVSGYTYSNDGDVIGNHGLEDYWVIKLDSSGNKQWQKTYGGSNYDDARSIIQSSDGNYIVAGTSSSNNGDVTNNHGNSDFWVLKINSTGGIIWQKTYGGNNGEALFSIIESQNGGYILVGQSDSHNGDVTENKGLSDFWIVKISDTGNLEWQKSYGGSQIDRASSIQNTSDGGYIVAGYSLSNDGDVSGHHGNNILGDCWIIKLNNIGNIQWEKAYGGNNGDYATSIVQDTDGGFVFLSYSNSTDGDVTNNLGNYDYWVVKLKPGNMSVKNNIDSSFFIYPNPTKDIVYFSKPIKYIEVYSIDGKLLIKKEKTSNLNIANLPVGSYIVKFIDSHGKDFIKKIIKK